MIEFIDYSGKHYLVYKDINVLMEINESIFYGLLRTLERKESYSLNNIKIFLTQIFIDQLPLRELYQNIIRIEYQMFLFGRKFDYESEYPKILSAMIQNKISIHCIYPDKTILQVGYQHPEKLFILSPFRP
jgi:hypothetical protein